MTHTYSIPVARLWRLFRGVSSEKANVSQPFSLRPELLETMQGKALDPLRLTHVEGLARCHRGYNQYGPRMVTSKALKECSMLQDIPDSAA